MAVVACAQCGARNRVDEGAAASRRPVCGRCGTALDVAAGTAAGADKPITVTDETFAREVLQARGVPVLLDCWAEWCGPCRMVAPVLDEIAGENKDKLTVAKLDIDANPETARTFQVMSIPTMIVFQDGKPVKQIVGAKPKAALLSDLADYLA